MIYHGGFGSTMEILRAGKPSIVIPSHTEQEGNGRRLEQVGVSKTLLVHNKDLKALNFSWPYGTYNMFAGFNVNLNADTLLPAVKDLIEVQKKEDLQNFSSALNKQTQNTDFEGLFKV